MKKFNKTAKYAWALSFLLLPVLHGNLNAQNLNGSFESATVTEQADTMDVEGWSFELSDGGDATFAIVNDEVKDGNRALRIDVNTAGPNDWSIQAINEPFEVEPGINYTFSAWAKASEVGATANFTVGNPSFNEFGRIDKSLVTLTTEWQEFTFDFQVNAIDSIGRAPIHLSMSDNNGLSIWIDSVRIQKPEEPGEVFEPIATGKPKFLGNIYSSIQRPRFAEYWNQVTPENAGKWGSVEAERDVMNWQDLDAAYVLAKDNGFLFRFHVLVWGNQQPEWMKTLSEEEQLEEIEEWFTEVAARYPDIDYLEVVNEPLHDPPSDDPNDPGSGGYMEALGGSGETGWDWIITAFEMADRIFADSVKLMINDYNILGISLNVTNYLEIINLLLDRDLIDAIGAQGHHFSTKNVNAANIDNNLNRLGAVGLPVQVTELDINGTNSDNSEAAQLAEYERIFPTIWEHESVIGVTLWGWRPGLWVDDALLISSQEEERASLEWLRTYVETTEIIVSNEEENENYKPIDFRLFQNYPNPFNPVTQISYQVPGNGEVTLKVFDITGRVVATLVNESQSPGIYSVAFDASALSSGIYLYELRSAELRSVRKMMLVK
ncbi:MAG: endo-1,4-beta-xylanase [Balneolales bacterium]|nr:endo-1,4-beta-xylanase [Balneolales bacterium]